MKSRLIAIIILTTVFLPVLLKAGEPNFVMGWGDNSHNQCIAPEPNTDFIAVSAGYYHSLALRRDGSISSWGDDTYNQNTVPLPNSGFIAISEGYYHSMAIRQDGSIELWGSSDAVPLPNSDFKAISSGVQHSLALKTDGSIVAWGGNAYGQLNIPGPNSDFIAVAAGWYHSMGLKSNGTIVVWGDNGYGQLNIPVGQNANFVAIAAGAYHCLGLKSNGSIMAWGRNTDNQTLVPLPNSGFSKIGAGAGHSVAIRTDGSVTAWGWNQYGQTSASSSEKDFLDVSGGYTYSLSIKNSEPNVIVEKNLKIEFKGMNYVGWSQNAFSTTDSNISLENLSLTGCQWVSLNVWWFQDTINSTNIAPDYSLYSVSPESVKVAVERCHQLGMKVMLKPNIDVKTGEWRANIEPNDEWFAQYHQFINYWADFAKQNAVEMLCIGCELENSAANPVWADDWRSVANDVRTHYSGPLTYAANHQGEQNVSWWDAVDYIGIDAYYPLTDVNNPTVAQLSDAWRGWMNNYIGPWRSANWPNKKVIFTEVGYSSFDGTNRWPWLWPPPSGIDVEEQNDCYKALLSVCSTYDWWGGVFWWSWETNPDAGGLGDAGFTPQNKLVEQGVLKDYYTTLTGDINGDCKVNIFDVEQFCDSWLDPNMFGWPDFNNDNKVNLTDFALLSENWRQALTVN